jgi:hypothetical protein
MGAWRSAAMPFAMLTVPVMAGPWQKLTRRVEGPRASFMHDLGIDELARRQDRGAQGIRRH